MIRLQRWESGPYFAAFSLHIPDMRSFIKMREIVKICPRSATASLSNNQVRQAPSADHIVNLRLEVLRRIVLNFGQEENKNNAVIDGSAVSA
jgi:hypothetical protein